MKTAPTVVEDSNSPRNENTTGYGGSKILSKFGVTEQSVKQARRSVSRSQSKRSSQRQTHIDDIRKYATEIIEEHGGNPLVSARQVYISLIKRGRALTKGGMQMQDSKGLGDALGGHGLGLPYVQAGSTRLYLLTAANADEMEIAEAKKALHEQAVKQAKTASAQHTAPPADHNTGNTAA